jgi:UDP-N-acetylglucosamine--N-acetylmuramyl-(pentapeptide) pyrophosphoryl-undecaprenol N-acetylglucosamine transferase
VVGVGGYSTFPVLRYAQSKGIPSFIHESNSFPGKSNIMLGKRAVKIFVPSEGLEKYFPAEKIMITGNPVRNIFSQKISKTEALNFFGLNPDMRTVFVMGGSLGAKSINETVEENIDFFKNNSMQLIWQTGKNFTSKTGEERMNIWTNAFIDKMENAYAAADVVIARSGAMTVAEMCVVAKPAIFVPFPFAAEDHQTVNAKVLADKKAALMVPDAKVKSELFVCLLHLINDKTLMEELKNNISKMSNTNADEKIADEILKIMIPKKYSVQ